MTHRSPFRPAALPALAALLWAGAAAGDESSPGERIAELVRRFRGETRARVGVHAVRLDGGRTLCAIDADRPMVPASNQKVLTSAVALKRLGADFRFRTRVGLSGDDLVVYGDGDPTTGDARLCEARGEGVHAVFDRWAAALKAAGVERIAGDLVIRAGIFRPPRVHPDWPRDQLQRWYAAPVAGANYNDNCLDIGFEVAGGKARPRIRPVTRFLAVHNKVKVAGKHVWSCRFSSSGRGIRLTGWVKRTTPDPYPVAVPRPAVLFGCVLAERLARAGIEVNGRIRTTAEAADAAGARAGFRPVATAETPLADVLARANTQSLNMMAECLFLRSAAGPGRPASWGSAARTAAEVLREAYGLDERRFRVADGSGLSKRNRVTPAAITRLLRALASEGPFVDSLAVAGRTGSARRRLKRCRGRLRVKTGSLAGASALSGYVLDPSGRPAVAFSILTNGRTHGKKLTAKRMEDAICECLLRGLDAARAEGDRQARPAAGATTRPARRRSPRRGP